MQKAYGEPHRGRVSVLDPGGRGGGGGGGGGGLQGWILIFAVCSLQKTNKQLHGLLQANFQNDLARHRKVRVAHNYTYVQLIMTQYIILDSRSLQASVRLLLAL